jgi:hypothetical protein
MVAMVALVVHVTAGPAAECLGIETDPKVLFYATLARRFR